MAESNHPDAVAVAGTTRVYDGFFKIDRLNVSHELFGGGMSPAKPIEVIERGDAVAALLFDVDRQEVVLVDQFRAPTMKKSIGRGWLVETAAGMINDGETPEVSLFREIQEETGYRIAQVAKIAQFFTSPGGSSERIFLYYAEVRRTDLVPAGGGISRHGVDLQLVRMSLDVFFRQLANREFEDPKLIIAGLWFKERHSRTELAFNKDRSITRQFALKKAPKKRVGYKTGNILLTNDVDVWVNNENTDMMMDRFFGRSVSATIRLAGAEKFDGTTRVKVDTVADALRATMRGRTFVKPATVLETTSGELERTHHVRRVFHVAAVEGNIGQGVKPSLEMLEACVDGVLAAIDAASGRIWPYRSVLIPLLGTGEGGASAIAIAPRLVDRAITYLEANPQSRLEDVYFVAYSFGDEQILEAALKDSTRLTPDASPAR